METVLLTGASGMLGQALQPVLEAAAGMRVLAPGLEEFDLTALTTVEDYLDRHELDRIVHAAAYTDVDGAETEAMTARAINGLGTALLARCAADAEIPILYISTDYVFDGQAERPYLEHDSTNPRGVYARTKHEGELAIRALGDLIPWTIVRTSWLYGPGGRNFVDTIYRAAKENPELCVVDDQTGCPTYTHDLAAGIGQVLQAGATGIVHLTNADAVTWCGLAREIVTQAGLDVPVYPITTEEAARPAPRPAYSVLGSARLAELGLAPLRPWRDALGDYLKLLAD